MSVQDFILTVENTWTPLKVACVPEWLKDACSTELFMALQKKKNTLKTLEVYNAKNIWKDVGRRDISVQCCE